MISTDLFDGAKNRLENKIVKYVNDNLKIIIGVYLDYLNADDGFDVGDKLMEVLPRDYVIRKLDECRRLVDELYEIIGSSVIRDYIKPKYEYLLYHIMYWWKDICDNEDDYLPIKLNDELKKEIYASGQYISEEDESYLIIRRLEHFEDYFIFCFEDHDFMLDSLERMVTLYLRSPSIVEGMFPDVDLDDYVDLMPVDLREQYYEKRQAIAQEDSLHQSFIKLYNDLINTCLKLQGNITYKNVSENERNTYIASLLDSAGYYVKDQTLWGKSSNGKAAGEIDIFVSLKRGEPFSIIEALNLNSLDKGYIDSHLKKIFGYDTSGLRHNFILIYYTAKNFSQFWEKYVRHIQNFTYPYDFIRLVENDNRFSEIRSVESVHVRNNKKVSLYHIAVNIAD